MKHSFLLLLLLSFSSFAQIKGTVKDEKGNPIPFANIYVKDTYISTTSNDQGKYELNVKKEGTYIILYQYLGFKTQKETVVATKFPTVIDVILREENIELNEVVIDKKENPANEIIRKAIANRKENSKKTARYNADFYSRGIFRVKDLPKKILGQKIDMFDDIIDSTRSGILYLSETVSKISFQKPDKMKETIVASKVSGDDNGFSFNNAASVNFDFYENYIEFNINVVSPIAENAFNYYKYKFDGSFADENNQVINKIKVIPRRDNEPVMQGYIYIVDDSWAIYAVDLSIKGSQMQTPALNTMNLKQSYSYNTINKIWIKNTQTIDFEASIFTLKMNGRFTYVFSNFDFPEQFAKKTFTSEVLKFEENANKKEDSFWNAIRPVPLSEEESADYTKKDLLQTKKKSKPYLDSIDKKKNRFHMSDVIFGYNYTNSFKKWSLNYEAPIRNLSFNTVQGWKAQIGFSYLERDEEKRTYTSLSTRFDYGFSENKLRSTLRYTRKFNNKDNSTLTLFGGSSVNQFNAGNPISDNVNSTATLFFKNNFMKLYEKNFAAATFSREVTNGLNMGLHVEYSERKPLENHAWHSAVNSDDVYTSNNPLLPYDYVTPAFEKHNLAKAEITARINFGQKYWTRPDGKFNIRNEDYPTIHLNYEKGFASNDKKYEYDFIGGAITHELTLGNKGVVDINIKAGKFFNAEGISFVDYKHFNGNQTHVSSGGSYTNVFNNLPYYTASTNDSYVETHIEHNDRGYFMNKLPLLKKLQSQLVLGFHSLGVPDRKPYNEFSVGLDNLGFGKLKLFRIDYVRSYEGSSYSGDAIIFGIKFLNIIE